MATSVLVVAACATLAFFALVLLGTLRELSIARTEIDALMRVLQSPASPTFLQQRLPNAIRARLPLTPLSGGMRNGHRRHVLVAVSEACSSCSRFLESLSERHTDGRAISSSITCLLRVSTPKSPLVALAERVGADVVIDTTGDLFQQLEVSATPAMFALDMPSAVVVGHKVGPDATWLYHAVNEPNAE